MYCNAHSHTHMHMCMYIYMGMWASLVAQLVKNLPAMRQTWVRSLGWEDPLEKGKANHSSILAWRIPWTVWSPKESDMTEQLSLSCVYVCIVYICILLSKGFNQHTFPPLKAWECLILYKLRSCLESSHYCWRQHIQPQQNHFLASPSFHPPGSVKCEAHKQWLWYHISSLVRTFPYHFLPSIDAIRLTDSLSKCPLFPTLI